MWLSEWRCPVLLVGLCNADLASEHTCLLLIWDVKVDRALGPSACCFMPVLANHARLFVLPYREQYYLSDPESVQRLRLQWPEGAPQVSVPSSVSAYVLHPLMQHMELFHWLHLVFLDPSCNLKCSVPEPSPHGLTALACRTLCSAHCRGWAAKTIHWVSSSLWLAHSAF